MPVRRTGCSCGVASSGALDRSFQGDLMAGFLLLHVPWGLFGPAENRFEVASPDAEMDTSRSTAPLLVSADAGELFLDGRADGLEPVADIVIQEKCERVWEPPMPIHAADSQTLRHASWPSDLSFRWQDWVDRPQYRSDEAAAAAEPGWPRHRLLMAVMARMQDFEAALENMAIPWDTVLLQWIDPRRERDPTMDIVVRHAEEHRARWVDIAEHPRRLLNRRRELVPLSRVQELDTQCMAWLSRQPGTTLAERAGGRQRILALSRYENRNTLENRVFRDLLERTVAASREYLDLNRGRSDSSTSRGSVRSSVVRQYGRECHRLSAALADEGVPRVVQVETPNYVLQHDNRYQHVWTAWQEIISRERAMDDLWRWQRRSWAEFCKTVVAVALQVEPEAYCVAGSPILFRPEHHRGHWLLHDDPLAVIARDDRGWVSEVLSAGAPDLPQVLKRLGAAVWLRAAHFSDGEPRYLPIWAVHDGSAETTLARLVASADQALRDVDDPSIIAGGAICQSNLEPSGKVSVQYGDLVTGFAFGPWDDQLPRALEMIGRVLCERIEAR